MLTVVSGSVIAGHLPDWAAVITLLAIAWVVLRGGGGTALGVLREANRVLSDRVHDLEQQSKKDMATIAELKARTDVAKVFEPLASMMREHEAHAQERSDATVQVLTRIAEQMSTARADRHRPGQSIADAR